MEAFGKAAEAFVLLVSALFITACVFGAGLLVLAIMAIWVAISIWHLLGLLAAGVLTGFVYLLAKAR